MVTIDNLKTNPDDLVVSGKNNSVLFEWNMDIDDETDKPIAIEFVLESPAPLFFLDENNNEVKGVSWEITDVNTPEETLFIDVTDTFVRPKTAIITMNATGKKGNVSSCDCTIKYK